MLITLYAYKHCMLTILMLEKSGRHIPGAHKQEDNVRNHSLVEHS